MPTPSSIRESARNRRSQGGARRERHRARRLLRHRRHNLVSAAPRDGTLTRRQQLASGLGTTRAEYGAVLPLVFIARTNTVVIIYRQSDGRLWERRVVNDGLPTPAVQVTDRFVVQHAVDCSSPRQTPRWME